jgi:hypothetical protein
VDTDEQVGIHCSIFEKSYTVGSPSNFPKQLFRVCNARYFSEPAAQFDLRAG